MKAMAATLREIRERVGLSQEGATHRTKGIRHASILAVCQESSGRTATEPSLAEDEE